MLDLRIQLGPQEHDEPRDVEPEQQHHHAPDGAIRLRVGSEVDDVELEPERGGEPEHRREHGAGGDPDPLLLGVRPEVVEEPGPERHQGEDDRPLEDLPRPGEDRAEAGQPGDVVRRGRPEQHQREGHQDEGGESQGEPDGEEPHLPPGPRFLDVVGAVQRVDRPQHRRRAAPQRDEEAERQDAPVLTLRDLPDLVLDDRDDVGRHDPAERRDDAIQEVLERKEAGQRDADQDGGEEGEEEVVRELGREPEAIVGHELLDRARDELAPGERQPGEPEGDHLISAEDDLVAWAST